MASMCPSIVISPTFVSAPQPAASHGSRCSFGFTPMSVRCRGRNQVQVIRMAPDEQWRVRSYLFDDPDWVRPKPAWRPDNFPEFPPFATPPPIPIAYDPLGEEEMEEEEIRREEEEWQQPEQEASANRSWMKSNKRYY